MSSSSILSSPDHSANPSIVLAGGYYGLQVKPPMDTDITLTTDDAVKSAEMDNNRIGFQSTADAKPLSFTNGVLKRHRHHINPPPATTTVAYKECLKNHAAAQGGHALDGCGEFMPSPSTNPNLPTSLKCAACGCHRNFHRRESEDSPSPLQLITPPPISSLEYQPQHRYHPPQPLPSSARATGIGTYPPSPPPISSSYYPSSAPQMLLALSTGLPSQEKSQPSLGAAAANQVISGSSRKRFRTKFSNEQKEKMYQFADRLGWKLQKTEDEVVNEFCQGLGIGREVFKVWMHNNKSTLGKRSSSSADACHNNGYSTHHHHHEDVNNGEVNITEQHIVISPHHHHSLSHNHNNLNGDDHMVHQHHPSEGSCGHMTTNGSFSSS